jgi:predicted Zn-dependent protease
MSETLHCPDCGHENPAGSKSCSNCNFPLTPLEPAPRAASAAAPEPPRVAPDAGGAAPAEVPKPYRMLRPRRPRPTDSGLALSLWLMFGVIAAAAVIFVGVRANVERAQKPIEGAHEDQQKRADALRDSLATDSTNVSAHVGLGDVLYDTGNWSEAIVQYRAALARDSSRATTIVDLGVCYYNLGDVRHAEELFQAALRRDPHQAVALFNLGIVYERREDYNEALRYFHRAMESDPPEGMKQPLVDAMMTVQKKLGIKAPPLPDGSK